MDLMDYRRKIIANSPHLKSASGAVATFSDGADLPLKSLNVDIKPVQDLHGYDYPWVGGGGVNKIDYLSCIGIGGRDGTDSIFGNNTSISGNQLTINRSYAQGGGLLKGVGVFPMSTGDKVTISGSVTLTNTNRMYVGVGNYDGGGTNGILVVRPSNGKFVVTVTAGSDYAKTGIFLQPESANSSMVVSNVMVALGETEKPYAPYENICPISGWNGVKVTRCGKNLSPINENNVSPRSYWGTNWTELIAVLNTLPVGVYTISNKFTVSTLPNNGQVAHGRIYITAMVNGTQRSITSYSITNDTSPTVGKVYQESGTFTITEEIRGNINHAYLYCDSTDHSASSTDKGTYTLTDVQIELGSTATTYEPYNGLEVAIDLGQTVYGGTLNPLTGVLTVDRRFLVLSSSGSGTYGYNSTYGQLRITGLKAMSNTIENICSHYKSFSGSFANLPDKSFMASSSTIAIKDSNYTSLANWKSYLDAQLSANTPVQVCAKLQTAEVIQLTPQQVRSLYGNNTIFANTGNVALEYWAHQ